MPNMASLNGQCKIMYKYTFIIILELYEEC